jgi:hypothetical protein
MVLCMLSIMTDSTLTLHEAGGRIKPREGKGHKYRARIMGWEPGAEYVEGSGGMYPVAAIKRDFAEAFPAGTRMRANHDGFCEMGGDIKRIVAKTTSVPVAERDGMYVDMYVAEDWSKFAEEFADVIGLSISASAAVEMIDAEDEDGEPIKVKRLLNGKPVVERFFTAEEAPYNAIDLVEAPGADGRITALLESAAKGTYEGLDIRHHSQFVEGLPQIRRILQLENDEKKSKADQPRHTQEGNEMTPDEMAAALKESEGRLATLVESKIAEAFKPAETPAPTASSADVAEAVAGAKLSKTGSRLVFEAFDRGEDYKAVLESQATLEKEILEGHKPEVGFQPGIIESGSTGDLGSSRYAYAAVESNSDSHLNKILGV